jgi:pyruvate dehydrogenase complex dehydrogenase (E1) component
MRHLAPKETSELEALETREWLESLEGETGAFVAASDYLKALPASVAKWIPGKLVTLGTDGFGRRQGHQRAGDQPGEVESSDGIVLSYQLSVKPTEN